MSDSTEFKKNKLYTCILARWKYQFKLPEVSTKFKEIKLNIHSLARWKYVKTIRSQTMQGAKGPEH